MRKQFGPPSNNVFVMIRIGKDGRGVLTSGLISLFTGPHQISFSELGSRTIRLSEGERPVFAPE